jgi:osmotically-inducible protein OsmY
MKKIFVAIAAVVALAGCSSVPVQRTAEFTQADTNNDGRVVLTEWLRFGGVESSFLAADTDRRGFLDETQFRQALRFNDEATGKGAERNQKVYDAQISADVKRSLEQSRDLNAWNIKVEVYQGEVTLSGPVRTSREKQAAEQLAAGVVGVKTVFNQLAIRQ